MASAVPNMHGPLPRTEGAGLETRHTRLGRIALRNFKGHKSLDLDLGRITALIGPSGSGKSTVLQALLMLKAALEGRGGAYDGESFADMVSDRDEARRIRIGVEGKKITGRDGAPDIASAFAYSAEFGKRGHADRVDATVEMRRGSGASGPYEARLEHAYDGGRGGGLDVVTGAWMPAGHAEQAGAGGGFAPRVRPCPGDHPAAGAFAAAFADGEYFQTLLDGVWHVPFSRAAIPCAPPPWRDAGAPPAGRAKGAHPPPPGRPGADPPLQDRVSSLLADVGLGRVAPRVAQAAGGGRGMPAAGVAGGMPSNAAAHEGSGASQLAMLLAVLAGSPRGSVITIEEPEIHLDPETQSRLVGAMLRLAVEEDKQVIFTSHSSHILYPLLGHVRKEWFPITNGDVVINHFDTDESGAVAGAERLAVNERGQVDGGLRGFWNANMKALDDLLG